MCITIECIYQGCLYSELSIFFNLCALRLPSSIQIDLSSNLTPPLPSQIDVNSAVGFSRTIVAAKLYPLIFTSSYDTSITRNKFYIFPHVNLQFIKIHEQGGERVDWALKKRFRSCLVCCKTFMCSY